MKSNTDNYHLIIVNNRNNDIKIGNNIITSKTSVKLLGVTIDSKLNFNEHVDAKKLITSYKHLLE